MSAQWVSEPETEILTEKIDGSQRSRRNVPLLTPSTSVEARQAGKSSMNCCSLLVTKARLFSCLLIDRREGNNSLWNRNFFVFPHSNGWMEAKYDPGVLQDGRALNKHWKFKSYLKGRLTHQNNVKDCENLCSDTRVAQKIDVLEVADRVAGSVLVQPFRLANETCRY